MDEVFRIGGCKILKSNKADVAAVVAAGITLHEALRAYEELKQEGILVRVIDLYSIKPLDAAALTEAARDTGAVITVEDHFAEGGLGEAVMSALTAERVPVYSLAVRKMPRSGKPDELLSMRRYRMRRSSKVKESKGGKRQDDRTREVSNGNLVNDRRFGRTIGQPGRNSCSLCRLSVFCDFARSAGQ